MVGHKNLLLLAVLLVLLLTNIVYAVDGHVAVHYDTLIEEWEWEVEVNEDLTSFLTLGFNMTTYAPEYGFKHFIPSWIPFRLDYRVYAEFIYKDFSIRITDWCDHWFSQSHRSDDEDEYGLMISLKYIF